MRSAVGVGSGRRGSIRVGRGRAVRLLRCAIRLGAVRLLSRPIWLLGVGLGAVGLLGAVRLGAIRLLGAIGRLLGAMGWLARIGVHLHARLCAVACTHTTAGSVT